MALLARSKRRAAAFTLIELLIVIGIMVLLTAVAIPLVSPSFQDRKVREASRQLNAFFAGAKAMAAERGRPFGVWFERSTGNLNQCIQLHLAEIPPAYTGDFLHSRVTSINATTGLLSFAPAGMSLATPPSGAVSDILQNGESFLIRFDFKGDYYGGSVTSGSLYLSSPYPTISANGAAFQIYRNPRKTSAAPLELSGGIAVDLGYSGLGAAGMEFDAWQPPISGTPQPPSQLPVVVLFSPGGQVSQVYGNNLAGPPSGPIHLLLGRNETIAVQDAAFPQAANPKLGDPNNYGNLQDSSSFWFSIGHRNGSLTTSENYWDAAWTPWTIGPSNPLPLPLCRQYARTTQTKGGG